MGIFSESATEILRQRYLLKNAEGEILEDAESMLQRVAGFVASLEKEKSRWAEQFYAMMAGKRFLPNSPTLANAGKPHGQLAACFVLPVSDSIDGIFETVKKAALIHKTGGGTGFSFSKIRPRNDLVQSTGGRASGPVPFIRVFDCATDVVKQGGMRKGANMAVLDYWHPDIMEFIQCKSEEGTLNNFNISVAADVNFMSAVLSDCSIDFINPRTGTSTGKRFRANDIMDLITKAAWDNGEPGMLFFDHINKGNTLPGLGSMQATNPCGEQPLFDYESCNLGSLNLVSYISEKREVKLRERIRWDLLKEDIFTAVRFLDDVIDVNNYVFPEIAHMTQSNRKIGLGIMGFADMLILLGIPYASKLALEFIHDLMGFIKNTAQEASMSLGREKGCFANIDKSIYKGSFMRNATVTTIAPTGTLSMLTDTSSGIEPLFGLSFIKEILNRKQFPVTNETFRETAQKRGFWSEDLEQEIAETGSLKTVKGVPDDVKEVFVTALDITPEWHVMIQAAFQHYVDNAVSKTVNFPNDAVPEDVRKTYVLAWKMGCKGITIYRNGSRKNQVLNIAGARNKPRDFEVRCTVCDD